MGYRGAITLGGSGRDRLSLDTSLRRARQWGGWFWESVLSFLIPPVPFKPPTHNSPHGGTINFSPRCPLPSFPRRVFPSCTRTESFNFHSDAYRELPERPWPRARTLSVLFSSVLFLLSGRAGRVFSLGRDHAPLGGGLVCSCLVSSVLVVLSSGAGILRGPAAHLRSPRGFPLSGSGNVGGLRVSSI